MDRADKQTFFSERRSGKDRRKKSFLKIQFRLKGGQRQFVRRLEDRNKIFWADQYSQTLFAGIVLILFLSVLDALLTLYLIGHNAEEINPIMAYYLDVGPYTFFTVKYLLTSLAVVILLLCQNVFLRTIGVYTHSLFYIFIAILMAVVVWELFLILIVAA